MNSTFEFAASSLAESKGVSAPIPTSTAVLAEIPELVPVLYKALESGTHAMRSFFEDDKAKPDAFLAPALVRYYAKKFLSSNGVEETELDVEDIANNGLSLMHNSYHLRILKSDNGQLPPPGDSERKQKFYSQQMTLGVRPSGVATTLNLVVLWDFDAAYNLRQLWLSCPKAGGIGKASVEEHWSVALPHPATAEHSDPGTVESDDDDFEVRVKNMSAKGLSNA